MQLKGKVTSIHAGNLVGITAGNPLTPTGSSHILVPNQDDLKLNDEMTIEITKDGGK